MNIGPYWSAINHSDNFIVTEKNDKVCQVKAKLPLLSGYHESVFRHKVFEGLHKQGYEFAHGEQEFLVVHNFNHFKIDKKALCCLICWNELLQML